MENQEVKITKAEFDKIREFLSGMYANERVRFGVSGKELDSHACLQYMLLEAFVGYLNSKQALKKEVKFDKT